MNAGEWGGELAADFRRLDRNKIYVIGSNRGVRGKEGISHEVKTKGTTGLDWRDEALQGRYRLRQQLDYGREGEGALQWGADGGTDAPRKSGESGGDSVSERTKHREMTAARPGTREGAVATAEEGFLHSMKALLLQGPEEPVV